MQKIFEIDYDGTMVMNSMIKELIPVPYAIETLKMIQDAGHIIHLNTYRYDIALLFGKWDSFLACTNYMHSILGENYFIDKPFKIKEFAEYSFNEALSSNKDKIYIDDDESYGCPLINIKHESIHITPINVDWVHVRNKLIEYKLIH
jgi:hypothetical protein